ncbi:MAG: PD40 domain-containing protein, partial [Planctomycetes bacterium]|nr:PD40 domain-containing protein [Planctomycetota bacterium]
MAGFSIRDDPGCSCPEYAPDRRNPPERVRPRAFSSPVRPPAGYRQIGTFGGKRGGGTAPIERRTTMSQFRSVCGLILAAGMLTAGVCDGGGGDDSPPPAPGVIPSEFQAQYVAFESVATNLVGPIPTPGRKHIYLRNLLTGGTSRINAPLGAEPNGNSYGARMSADGRYVAFESVASNLVELDTNTWADVFVYDIGANTVERVSVDTNEVEPNNKSFTPSISANGRYVAFSSNASDLVASDTNGATDVFVRDRLLGTTELVSVDSNEIQGNIFSKMPSISADGRYVAFSSSSNNLVVGDTNSTFDIFVRDRLLGTTELVSVDSNEIQDYYPSYRPSISADGRYVAFDTQSILESSVPSHAYYNVYLRDRLGTTTVRISAPFVAGAVPFGNSIEATISADGRFVAFTSVTGNLVPEYDGNSDWDVFLRDVSGGSTKLISISTTGTSGNAYSSYQAISPDGRFVAFASSAKNLVPGDTNDTISDIFMRDLDGAGSTVKITNTANGGSWVPSVSSGFAPGRYAGFSSLATNLVANDTNGADDAFIQDLDTGTIRLVSVNNAGVQGDGASQRPSLSSDSRFVAFQSAATNLVSGDTNLKTDVFVRDRLLGITERVSVSTAGVQGDDHSFFPAISGDGRYVAFTSAATNFATTTAGRAHVYVRDRYAGTTELISVDTTGGEGDGHSSENTDNVAAISADGRFVVFASLATDLVVGDTNGFRDIFV